MNVEYTAQIWQEGDQFIAHAMPLDVMSAGRTPDEARKALDAAVHLFLVTAADIGTLEEVLQEAGYEFPLSETISKQRASRVMSTSVSWNKSDSVISC